MSIRVASSTIAPSATSTSGSAETLASTSAGNPSVVLSSADESAFLPLMTASAFSNDSAKIVSKPFVIVSVKM